MGVQRDDSLTIWRGGPLVHPHHTRLTGTIYISIQQTDLATCPRQRHSEVRAHGRFAHAPLARSNGENALHASRFHRAILRLRVPTNLEAWGRLLRRGAMSRQGDCYAGNAINLAHHGLCRVAQRGHLRGDLRIGGFYNKAHHIALDRQSADQIVI